MKIVVVVPAYNARETIESVFQRIPADMYDRLHEIIIVNDGSKDGTQEIMKKILGNYDKVKLLTHEVNKGYGATQKTGFKEALKDGADVCVLLHSDGQYPPEMLSQMIEPFKSEADVVMGSRILGGSPLKGGMPFYKYLGNRVLTFIENLAYGMNISEFHTGYMLYSRKTLENIPFERLSDSFHFDGEMVMMAGKNNLRIVEVPIPTRYAGETSHLNPITYGLDVLGIVIKYKLGKYDF